MSESKHYITLLNDQRVRVAFNINVYEEILSEIGESRFQKAAAGKLDLEASLIMYLAMIKAGEALDGRRTSLTLEDMRSLIWIDQAKMFQKAIVESSKEQFAQAISNNKLN